MKARKDKIRELVNGLNLGTQKEKVGDLLIELLERVDSLENKAAALEDRVADLEDDSEEV